MENKAKAQINKRVFDRKERQDPIFKSGPGAHFYVHRLKGQKIEELDKAIQSLNAGILKTDAIDLRDKLVASIPIAMLESQLQQYLKQMDQMIKMIKSGKLPKDLINEFCVTITHEKQVFARITKNPARWVIDFEIPNPYEDLHSQLAALFANYVPNHTFKNQN